MAKKMRRLVLVEPYKMQMEEADIPKPKAGEVRIRVQRIGVCGSDITIYRGRHPYVRYPLVMGHEIAGTIDTLGEGVTNLVIGMRVAIIPHLVCGKCEACRTETYNFCEQLQCTGAEADGAHCDYFCISAKMVIPIPDTMSLDEAAIVEPACVAYHGAKRGEISKNDKVLIIGAGPIGVFCMQSCKTLGAKAVYLADMDPSRLEIGLKLGADGVIDVSKETLKDGLVRLCGSEKNIDVFYDCVGEKGHVFNDILLLARRGTRVVVIGVLQDGCKIPNLPDFVQHELRISGTTMYVPQDYREMIALMGSKRIQTTGMISHYFELEEFPKVMELADKSKENTFKIIIKVAD